MLIFKRQAANGWWLLKLNCKLIYSCWKAKQRIWLGGKGCLSYCCYGKGQESRPLDQLKSQMPYERNISPISISWEDSPEELLSWL